jgi:hypothetical protein
MLFSSRYKATWRAWKTTVLAQECSAAAESQTLDPITTPQINSSTIRWTFHLGGLRRSKCTWVEPSELQAAGKNTEIQNIVV